MIATFEIALARREVLRGGADFGVIAGSEHLWAEDIPTIMDAITDGAPLGHDGRFSLPTYSPEGWPVRTVNYTPYYRRQPFTRIRLHGVLINRHADNLEYAPFAWLRDRGHFHPAHEHRSCEFDIDGILHVRQLPPEPIGGALLSYVLVGVRASWELRRAGLAADEPLAFGSFGTTEFGRSALGYCILGDYAASEDRGYYVVTKWVATLPTGEVARRVVRLGEQYGTILRTMHSCGFFHGAPHLNNFVFEEDVYIKDYEQVQHQQALSPPQALGYAVKDIRCAFVSIAQLLQWLPRAQVRACFTSFCTSYFSDCDAEFSLDDFVRRDVDYGLHMTNTDFDLELRPALAMPITDLASPLVREIAQRMSLS